MSTTYSPTTAKDPTEVIGRRIFAFIIDFVLVAAALAAVFGFTIADAITITDEDLASTAAATERCEEITNDDADDRICVPSASSIILVDFDEDASGSMWWAPAAAGLVWLLQAILQGITGATIGKFITGIRAVNRDGNRPGIFRSILRTIMYVIDGFPWAVPMVLGLIVAAVTKRHKRLGDMVAGTFVVRKSAMGAPVPDAGQFDVRLPPEQRYAAEAPSAPSAPSAPLTGAAAAAAAGAAAASRRPQPPAPSPTGELAGTARSAQSAAHQPPVAPPTMQQPVAEMPTQQPVAEMPTTELPSVPQPQVQHPQVQQPTIEQPAIQQPPVQQPRVEQPPVIQQQAAVQPPVAQQPVMQQSGIAQPPVMQPRLEQPPAAESPTYEAVAAEPVVPQVAEPTAGAYVAPGQDPHTPMQSGVIDPLEESAPVHEPVIQTVPQPEATAPMATPAPAAQPAGMPEGVVWDTTRGMYVFQDATRSLRWDPQSQMWLDLN